jgi:MFS family permease
MVVTAGLAGVGMATIAIGLSPTYYPMLAILVIMGIFAGAYHPSAVPMLSSYYDAGRRGKAIGLHMVGGSVGFALGPVIGGLIANQFEWRFAFIILGVPALLAAGLVFRRLSRARPAGSSGSGEMTVAETGKAAEAAGKTSLGQVLRPMFIIIGLVILTQLVAGAAISFIPVYLVDKHHIASTSAALLTGLLRGGGIAGSLFGGWFSDRWGRHRAIFLALVASGPVLLLLARMPFSAFLILTLVIFGVAGSMRQATAQPFLMDNTPPHLRATFFGIYFGLAIEGRSLIQPVVGYFMDSLGITPVFDFIALAGVALSLLALILMITGLGRKNMIV